MTSRTILGLHVVIVLLIFGCGLGSPLVALAYPDFFKGIYFPIVEVGMLGTVFSWPFFHGMCFMTLWENNLRRREGRRTYRGGCMDHYLNAWFGVTPPKGVVTALLLFCAALPIVVRILL